MRLRQVFEQVAKLLHGDQEGVQRIFRQLVRTREELVEEHFFFRQITFQQRMREFALVGEVVEKPDLAMPTAAMISSIDVPAKPFSSTAACATSRIRWRVSPGAADGRDALRG